jgi:hypothetical protein
MYFYNKNNCCALTELVGVNHILDEEDAFNGISQAVLDDRDWGTVILFTEARPKASKFGTAQFLVNLIHNRKWGNVYVLPDQKNTTGNIIRMYVWHPNKTFDNWGKRQ